MSNIPSSEKAPQLSMVRGTGAALGAALGFASVSILTSLALEEGVRLATVLAWRYLIASAVLLTWLAVTAQAVPNRRDLGRLLVVGGIGQGLIVYLALSSLAYIDAATLGFLFFTFPAWVAFFQVIRRAEGLDGRRIAALSLSLVGVMIIVGAPSAADLDLRGVGLALGAAVLYGAFIPMLRWLQGNNSITVTTAWTKVGAAAGLLLLTIPDRGPSWVLSGRAWGVIAILALAGTVAPSLLFLKSINLIGPVRTAIVSTVEPFLTALLSLLVLARPLSGPTLLGGTLIGLAVLLLQGFWSSRFIRSGKISSPSAD